MSETQKTKQTTSGSGSGTFTQTNTPQSDTPDINRLREQKFKIDPTIGHRVGGALRRMKDQMTNPLGGYGTGQTRDATMRSQERSLLESGSQAMREGAHDVNQQELVRNTALAGLTQGTTQTGSSTSTNQGTMTGESKNPLTGTIISAVAGTAGAAL